jgi:adenosylcobinamide-phosphate synthase
MPDGDTLAALGRSAGGSGQILDPWGLGLLMAQPLLLLIALAIEGVIGGLPRLWRRVPHPIALLGRLIAFFDRRLNREDRSPASRRTRGIIVAVFLIALASAIGGALQFVARNLLYGWVIELGVLIVLLSGRSLFDHVRAVAVALDRGGLAAGRDAVRHIVGRDVAQLDEHGVARAAIESAAENFSDAVVAPVCWYLLLGLPGLLIYKTVNTMDSMIGYRTPRHAAFGMAAARTDDALNFIPARLSALMIVAAAAFTPGGSPRRAWRTLLRDGGNHASPNSGRPEAAMAGALGLALAGPRPYHGAWKHAPWIGDGLARATAADILRALFLYAVASLLNFGLVACFAFMTAVAAGAFSAQV